MSGCYPKFIDTKTGVTRMANYPFSLYWWSYGNGSCDCNRAPLFDMEDDLQMDLGTDDNTCFGCTRFIAIDVFGDLEGMSKQEALAAINDEYPSDLIAKAEQQS